ncbi:MAG: hypothetical protein QXL86_02025 [Candidatus Aenigmatarchaeota archaeon]
MIIKALQEIMVYERSGGPPKIMSLKDALIFPPPPFVQPEEISTLIISELENKDKIIVAMNADGKIYYRMEGWKCKGEELYKALRKIEKGIAWTYK